MSKRDLHHIYTEAENNINKNLIHGNKGNWTEVRNAILGSLAATTHWPIQALFNLLSDSEDRKKHLQGIRPTSEILQKYKNAKGAKEN